MYALPLVALALPPAVVSSKPPAPTVEALIRDLAHKDARVVKAAAEALGAMGPKAKAAAEPLVHAVQKHPDPLRSTLVAALDKIGRDAAKAVAVLLKARDIQLRLVAIRLLAGMGPPSSAFLAGIWHAYENKKEPLLRAAAGVALYMLGVRELFSIEKTLIEVLDSPSKQVRRVACVDVGRLGLQISGARGLAAKYRAVCKPKTP